jgi:hypothetical protein
MRLIGFDQIAQPKGEYLWFNDSVMTLFSRDGATGYDTALQRKEADLFATFYSPNLRRLRSTQPLLRYGVQSSIVWPEAEGVLGAGDRLGKVNLARLQLLGVGHLLWSRRIANLVEPRWDKTFQLWDHSLPSSSPVSLLRDVESGDVARLFSDAADDALADRILGRRQAAAEYISEESGAIRSILPTVSGLVVIAYNLSRFYQPLVNGSPPPLESTSLPFALLRKTTEPAAVMELRPRTRGIWMMMSAGLSLGGLTMAVIWWFSRSSAGFAGGPNPAEAVVNGFSSPMPDRNLATNTPISPPASAGGHRALPVLRGRSGLRT